MSDLLVLCYHAISQEWNSPMAVAPDELEHQLGALVRRGYRGAGFSEALTGSLSGKRLVVTFDDAYRSVLELALPIIDALDLRATVFVPTRFASRGQLASWSGMESYLHGPHAAELQVMTWDELALLSARGWEIGSHTQTHPHLTSLADDALLEELERSRLECQDRLGTQCLSLAYPYGDVDRRVMAAAVATGYSVAAGLPGHRVLDLGVLNWPRVGVYGLDGPRRFALKSSPVMRWMRTPSTIAHAPPRHLASPLKYERRSRTEQDARVAVILPCFNDGELVVEAVDSINEAEPVEVIVIDDASTDSGTMRALDHLRARGIRVIRHDENRGLPAARMTGLRATVAKYVFPLDADDLAVAGALTAMANLLDGTPDAAACFGDYAEFGTRDYIRRVPAWLDPYRVAYRNDYPVSSLFRRSVLQSVGGWQSVGSEIGYEDWHLWMTLAERGAVAVHWGNGVAMRRRLHGQRMLADAAKRHFSLYRTLRTLHPRLFAELRIHRQQTDLGPVARWLYPLVYGWRPPLSLRARAQRLVARGEPGRDAFRRGFGGGHF